MEYICMYIASISVYAFLVKITNMNHPHFGERGIIEINENGRVSLKTIGKKEMFEIKLIDCEHGVERCFVKRSDVTKIW